jgi:hypothetical protein
MTKFSSEGFDLDAITSATEVLELGGKVVQQEKEEEAFEPQAAANEATPTAPVTDPPISPAEDLKRQGNEAFLKKDWKLAYSLYTDAIKATPGLSGEELLKLQKEWQVEQGRKVREELRKRDADQAARTKASASNGKSDNNDDDEDNVQNPEPPATFQAPLHPHGKDLAVYYSNRAAASMQIAQDEGPPSHNASSASARSSLLDDDDDASKPPTNPRLQEAVQDCTIALLLQPYYVKALVRRCTAYERLNNTEAALADALAAQKLEPSNAALRTTVIRLQKLEDERMEKLKTETLAKLKDLGNSILGNFGLSLDSFNAQKDPNTGSYNISFNQK